MIQPPRMAGENKTRTICFQPPARLKLNFI